MVDLAKDVWSHAPRILIVLTCLGALYTGLTWLTGGLRPQSQIDIAALQGSAVQCSTRLDDMERSRVRASDIAGWEAHLSRLDARVDDLRDRISKAEATGADTLARVASLTRR